MVSAEEPLPPRAGARRQIREPQATDDPEPEGTAFEPPGQGFPRQLVEGLPVALLVVTPDMKVVFANAALYVALGIREQRIEGKYLSEATRLEGVEPLLSVALKGNRPLTEREINYRHPRRGSRWFRVTVSRLQKAKWPPFKDDDALLVLSLEDVTARRQAQERIQETNRLISLGELVAGVAHEINNPLTSVMGFAQLILERGPEHASKEELEIILSETQRVSKVVRNLLSFSRQYKAEKSLVDVPAVVERVLALKAYEFRISNVEVETRFPPDFPKAYADEHRLEQVFLNIVNNAEQAIAATRRRGRLNVLGLHAQSSVRVSFYDDGPGIPPQNLKAIFRPFFTTKEQGQGTGLGLSICRTLMQEQGGRIWAESESGKGAVFHVEIPERQR